MNIAGDLIALEEQFRKGPSTTSSRSSRALHGPET